MGRWRSIKGNPNGGNPNGVARELTAFPSLSVPLDLACLLLTGTQIPAIFWGMDIEKCAEAHSVTALADEQHDDNCGDGDSEGNEQHGISVVREQRDDLTAV